MSGYIFKPPPPPPPQSSTRPPATHRQDHQRGNYQGRISRRSRGGRDGSRGGGDRGGGGHGGHGGNYGRNNNNNYTNLQLPSPRQSTPLPTPAQQLQHLATLPQNTHINPAFFPVAQAASTQLPINPFFSQWQANVPPVVPQQQQQQQPSSYLSYAQESLTAPSQRQPSLRSYSDIKAPSDAPSYSRPPLPSFQPPALPPKSAKPDMSEEEWLAINGGKLIGTNVPPPKTAEEIAEWIAERKRRYPSKEKIAQKRAEEEARRKQFAAQREAATIEKQIAELQKRKRELETSQSNGHEKKQRLTGETRGNREEQDDSDSTPETLSSRVPVQQDTSNSLRGVPPRRDEKHGQERGKTEGKKNSRNGKREVHVQSQTQRKTLYARLLETEMERQNKHVVEVLKYLSEQQVLKDQRSEGG